MSGELLLIILASVLSTKDEGLSRHLREPLGDEILLKLSADECSKEKMLDSVQMSIIKTMPLRGRWSMWCGNSTLTQQKGLTVNDFLKSLERLESFSAYGEFVQQWRTVMHESVPFFSHLYVFKEHIRPVWEDESNSEGGKLAIYFPPESNHLGIFDLFVKIVVLMILSRFGDGVCGATLSVPSGDSGAAITIWNSNAQDLRQIDGIRRTLSAVYQGKTMYRPHKRSIEANKALTRRPTKDSGNRPRYYRHQFTLPKASRSCIKEQPDFIGSAPSRSAWASRRSGLGADSTTQSVALCTLPEKLVETTGVDNPSKAIPSVVAVNVDVPAIAEEDKVSVLEDLESQSPSSSSGDEEEASSCSGDEEGSAEAGSAEGQKKRAPASVRNKHRKNRGKKSKKCKPNQEEATGEQTLAKNSPRRVRFSLPSKAEMEERKRLRLIAQQKREAARAAQTSSRGWYSYAVPVLVGVGAAVALVVSNGIF